MPKQVTMVLGLLSLLIAVGCLFLFISFMMMIRLRKTSMIITLRSVVMLLLTLIIFYYAFAQFTKVGGGSSLISGTLDVTTLGEAKQI